MTKEEIIQIHDALVSALYAASSEFDITGADHASTRALADRANMLRDFALQALAEREAREVVWVGPDGKRYCTSCNRELPQSKSDAG